MAENPPPPKPECRDELSIKMAEYQHLKEMALLKGVGIGVWIGTLGIGVATGLVCYRIITLPADKFELSAIAISMVAILGVSKDLVVAIINIVSPSAVHQQPRRQADSSPSGTKGDPVATDATIVADETKPEKIEEKI